MRTVTTFYLGTILLVANEPRDLMGISQPVVIRVHKRLKELFDDFCEDEYSLQVQVGEPEQAKLSEHRDHNALVMVVRSDHVKTEPSVTFTNIAESSLSGIPVCTVIARCSSTSARTSYENPHLDDFCEAIVQCVLEHFELFDTTDTE